MKIVHTADWHIGKSIYDFSMLCDQEYYLDELSRLLTDVNADVLIIAGDLYDRSVPSAQAVSLVDAFLSETVIKRGIKVLCVAGNHDSGARLSFANKMLEESGLYICGSLTGSGVKKVSLSDEFGQVNFYMLPYIDPATVKALSGKNDITTFDKAYGYIMENLIPDFDPSMRNVLIAHGSFVFSGSGESDIFDENAEAAGGAGFANAARFSLFDYAALGHMHESSKVGLENIRYSGSILKYSAAEEKQNKQIPVISLGEKGKTNIEFAKIKPKRDLRVVRGLFEEISNPANLTQDYVFADLDDTEPIADAILRLKPVYPNILGLRYSQNTFKKEVALTARTIEKKTPQELFEDFYLAVSGGEMDDEQREIIKEIVKEKQNEAACS